MTALIVTRGLPASGKTTWAKAWVAVDVTRRARVERDQLRLMMHDGIWKGRLTENQIVRAQHAMIAALLYDDLSVVVSDTNLDEKVLGDLRNIAVEYGTEFEIQDFTDVPLSECLRRNALRTGEQRIPEKAIMAMHNKLAKEKHIEKKPKKIDRDKQWAKMTDEETFEYKFYDLEG